MRLIDADALHKTKIVERKQIFVDGKRRVTNLYTEVVMSVHVENAPTIDPESLRPTGEWEAYPSDQYRRCSHCKTEWEKEKIPRIANYCLYCGARMKKDGDA